MGNHANRLVKLISLTESSGKLSWIYAFIIMAIAAIETAIGPVISADTRTYERFSPTRQPLYCFVLWIFSDNYRFLVFLQVVAVLVGVNYVSKAFLNTLGLSAGIVFATAVILLVPAVSISSDIFGGGISTLIGPEALSYTSLLISLGLFISGIHENRMRKIIGSFVALLVLMLLRKQFLFMFPIYALVLLLSKHKNGIISLLFVLVVSFVFSNLVERIYHGLVHGHYTESPFTGIQLIVRPLWIADWGDGERLSGIEQGIFRSTIEQMDQAHLSLVSCKRTQLPIQCGYHHFLESYNKICWGVLYPTLKNNGVSDWWQIDQITTTISIDIIKANPSKYLREYLSAIKNGDGSYYFFLLLVIITWSMWQSLSNKTHISRITLLLTAMSLSNIILVSIVEPLLMRYTFYTAYPQIALFLAIFSIREPSDVRYSR